MRGVAWIGTVVVALSLVAASSAAAVSLAPLGGGEDPILFDEPIYVTSDPDDPDRLFVVEREGTVQEVTEGEATLFADLSTLVTSNASERGLFSIALAPDFALTESFYAAYTGTTAAGAEVGDIHIDTFEPSGEEGQVSRLPMITAPHPGQNNHNGGQLQIGPDGYLYISTGDGGGGGDQFENSQNLDSLLGKILRIEPHPEAEGAEPTYSVPADNPYAGVTAGRDEIWAHGLRNPWRFSFDSLTGDLIIGDVGQELYEEVDIAPAPLRGRGANFGWNCREGLFAFPSPADACEELSYPADFIDPVFEYPHEDPEDGGPHGCAITGGYVVRDAALGDLYGRYLYADFCVGQIRSFEPSDPGGTDRDEGLNPAPNPASNPVSFGEDACGRIYVVSMNQKVLRLVGEEDSECDGPPEEEPPVEEPPVERPPATAPPADLVAAFRFYVEVEADRDGNQVKVTAVGSPCPTARGLRVRLNRGGEGAGSRRLGRGCRATFRLRGSGPMSFRALLFLSAGGEPIRSKRARVAAAPRAG